MKSIRLFPALAFVTALTVSSVPAGPRQKAERRTPRRISAGNWQHPQSA